MATSIRLSRGGSKKRPYYRIVVADSRAPRDGKYIERIGSYNPVLPKGDEKRVVLDIDRAKHWVALGQDGVVAADALDKLAVTRCAAVGHDDAIIGALLGAAARQTDGGCHITCLSTLI